MSKWNIKVGSEIGSFPVSVVIEVVIGSLQSRGGVTWVFPVCIGAFPFSVGSTGQAGVSSWSVRRSRVMEIGHYGQ